MKTSEIKGILDYILPCTNVKLYDVLAYDLLNVNSINTFPAAFILNTAKHSNPGIHWVVLFLRSPKEYLFFCSYGNTARFYNFNFKPTKWNKTRFQSFDSNKCGQFSLVVLHQLALKNSFKKVLSLFSKSSPKKNDAFVQNYVNKITKLQKISKHRSGQNCITLRAFKNEYKRKRKHL